MVHKYIIKIEYNSEPGYKPITLTLEVDGEQSEISGNTLNAVLNTMKKWIVELES